MRQSYTNISDNGLKSREEPPWYWRLVAWSASWMMVVGYLLLPGLYAKDAQLKFSTSVLSVFVVALLTAGYSCTALLCFACRDEAFQAHNIFLYELADFDPNILSTYLPTYQYSPNTTSRPTLASSTLGLVSIAYNLFATRAFRWSHASMSGLALSGIATLLYGSLLLWRIHRIASAQKASPTVTPWSEPTFYTNYNANMYPTAARSPSCPAAEPTTPYSSEEEAVTRQMAILLSQRDPTPSPNATSTFQIAMPVDQEQERRDQSQELVGTPVAVYADTGRGRASSRPDSLSEHQAWERWQERGRPAARPSSTGAQSSRSRNLSREERRREIELGRL